MALTAIESFRGAKNKHPTILCVCDCGRHRIVRSTKFRLGLVTMCGACAKTLASARGAITRRKFSDSERIIGDRYSVYKNNAKRKNLLFDLPREVFSNLLMGSCTYCGSKDSVGVDRVDSQLGYLESNCVSCCSDCNYAKREMSREKFLSLVERIHAHQSQ